MILDPLKIAAGVKRQHPYALVIALARVGNQWWVGTNGKYRHAEEAVLRKVPRQIPGKRIHLMVFRVSTPPPKKNPVLTMAMPCIGCHGKIQERGIKPSKVWYTDWDGEWRQLNG